MEPKIYNIWKEGQHGNFFLKYAYQTKKAFIKKLAALGQGQYSENDDIFRRRFSHNGKEYRLEIFNFDEA